MDAQESTRFILLSPQIHQEKLRASIELRIAKDTRSRLSEDREKSREEGRKENRTEDTEGNTEESTEGNNGVILQDLD